MKPKMSIEYFKSTKNGQWYFRLVSLNGQPIAQSEGYTRKSNMMKTVNKYWPMALKEEVTCLK